MSFKSLYILAWCKISKYCQNSFKLYNFPKNLSDEHTPISQSAVGMIVCLQILSSFQRKYHLGFNGSDYFFTPIDLGCLQLHNL